MLNSPSYLFTVPLAPPVASRSLRQTDHYIMASVPDARRARHLYAVFKGALDGEKKITTATDAKLFYEAKLGQRTPEDNKKKIISSMPGPDGVRPGLDAVSR